MLGSIFGEKKKKKKKKCVPVYVYDICILFGNMCTDNAPAIGGGLTPFESISLWHRDVLGRSLFVETKWKQLWVFGYLVVSGGPWGNSGGLWGVSEGASGVLRGSSGGVLEGLWGISGWGREDPP